MLNGYIQQKWLVGGFNYTSEKDDFGDWDDDSQDFWKNNPSMFSPNQNMVGSMMIYMGIQPEEKRSPWQSHRGFYWGKKKSDAPGVQVST